MIAKKNLLSSLTEMIAHYKEEGEQLPTAFNNGNLDFVYKYDLVSIFNYFGMLDATNLARKIGMNPSLLRQYKKGITLPSEKQRKKIESGLHELGRQLLSLRL